MLFFGIVTSCWWGIWRPTWYPFGHQIKRGTFARIACRHGARGVREIGARPRFTPEDIYSITVNLEAKR